MAMHYHPRKTKLFTTKGWPSGHSMPYSSLPCARTCWVVGAQHVPPFLSPATYHAAAAVAAGMGWSALAGA
eukprot:1147151-Pelagomonas_calceolata.AAC.3